MTEDHERIDELLAGYVLLSLSGEDAAEAEPNAFARNGETPAEPLDVQQLARALGGFDRSWDQLLPGQQVDLLRLLVRRVDYNGRVGRIAIRFCPTGIARLATEATRPDEIPT